MAGSPRLAFFAEDEGRLSDGWGYLVRSFGLVGAAYRIGEGADSRIIELGGVAELPDLPIVLVSPSSAQYLPGTESLVGFTHPGDCIYLFGASNRVLTEDDLQGRAPVARVYVPAVGGTELFAHVAGAMVLWDREMKGG